MERDISRLLDLSRDQPETEATHSNALSSDDAILAQLGYKQELHRGLGLFENWAATFSCMNFVSGMPVLFSFIMKTGGPQAAFTSWTLVSIVSCLLALSMAEIAAALPTTGGIYFWVHHLGGSEWGPFLSWMTAWWNFAFWALATPGTQQGATNFLVSALEINFPDAAYLHQGWFQFLITLFGLLIALLPNITSQRLLQLYFRFAIAIFFLLFILFWIWFPIGAKGNFQSPDFVFQKFHNGISQGSVQQATNAYCWVISLLFGAWEFGGYDAAAHLAEETRNAGTTVARGMWLSTFSTTILSIPTLVLILFCIQDFDALITAPYANNWAQFLVDVVGRRGATAILVISWIDCTCSTTASLLSAQRVAFAISRDNILPGSALIKKVSGANSVPVNAAILVFLIAVVVNFTILGSTVAFSAITAATISCQNISYLFLFLTRYTFGRSRFKPASWNLGPLSQVIGYITILWLSFLSVVLLLPQVFPVTMQTLNYSPICLAVVTFVSLIGWHFPCGLGGRYWFKGPCPTLSSAEHDDT